jgi:ABC-type phosphate/phosphonate transport system substrate-binding protein
LFPRGQFWGSSEEVVKAVINGSAEIGACDMAVVDSVLRQNNLYARKSELVRELRRTDPIPRDPVVFLQKWSPQKSRLGRAIREASQSFFNEEPPAAPRLQVSSDETQFNRLRRAIDQFNQLRKQHGI